MTDLTSRSISRYCLIFSLLCPLVGCEGGAGDTPSLGTVSGIVTLDGKPVEGLDVHFEPENGRGSNGITDNKGRYELFYSRDNRGAKVGRHTVIIIRPDLSDSMSDEAQKNQADKPKPLPEQYNTASELTAEVKSGRNTFDFNLESDG